jgi:hypothetical protein
LSLKLSERLSTAGWTALADGLRSSHLRKLGIWNSSSLAHPVLVRLCETRLQKLTMNDCQIKDDTVYVLAKALTACSNLTSLTLEDNSITSRGVDALATNLVQTRLNVLNLSLNPVGDLGADLLATAIVASPECRLQKLKLRACGIRKRGGNALSECAGKLNFLDVRENEFELDCFGQALERDLCAIRVLRLPMAVVLYESTLNRLAQALRHPNSHAMERFTIGEVQLAELGEIEHSLQFRRVFKALLVLLAPWLLPFKCVHVAFRWFPRELVRSVGDLLC